MVADLERRGTAVPTTADEARGFVDRYPYLRATGWAAIEDYERLKSIAKRFNDLTAFIGRCNQDALEKSEAYRNIDSQLSDAKAKAKSEGDRNKRARKEAQIASLERQLRATIAEATGISSVKEWLLEGMELFVDTFMSNRVLLRLYPFANLPEFEILANLKRTCFVDGDLDVVLNAYGNRPNVQLTVVGLITSLPMKTGEPFDFTAYKQHSSGDEERQFEAGFRGVFDGFEGFYRFVRYARWPNVTIYPLAVYRDVGSDEDAHGAA